MPSDSKMLGLSGQKHYLPPGSDYTLRFCSGDHAFLRFTNTTGQETVRVVNNATKLRVVNRAAYRSDVVVGGHAKVILTRVW